VLVENVKHKIMMITNKAFLEELNLSELHQTNGGFQIVFDPKIKFPIGPCPILPFLSFEPGVLINHP
jgi:hypothetical protein